MGGRRYILLKVVSLNIVADGATKIRVLPKRSTSKLIAENLRILLQRIQMWRLVWSANTGKRIDSVRINGSHTPTKNGAAKRGLANTRAENVRIEKHSSRCMRILRSEPKSVWASVAENRQIKLCVEHGSRFDAAYGVLSLLVLFQDLLVGFV